MPLLKTIMLLAALLAIAACRSDPIHFYTLSPIRAGVPVAVDDAQVEIEVINMPAQLDRQQIVLRQSDSSLAILESHRWGSSLTEELRSALAQQLPNNGAERRVSVRLDVLRLDSVPGQYALIDVRWRLRNLEDGGSSMAYCRGTLRTAAGVSVDDIVNAHQNNVQRLAEQIRHAANRLPQTSCGNSRP